MGSFQGFPKSTFEFLQGLEKNNSKDWFDANRDTYDHSWKTPALDFIAALSGEMAQLSPPLQSVPKLNSSLRRINRDVRFSKDKTPYNARLHLVFWAGTHPNRSAGFHFVIHSGGIGFGAGAFGFDAAALTAYRDAVMVDEKRQALQKALQVAHRVGSELEAPALARLPRGYVCDADWADLLRHKSVVARTPENIQLPGWITNNGAVDGLMALAKAHAPLIAWLHAL